MGNIPVDELRKLKTLLDEGVISKDEFIEARNNMLNGSSEEPKEQLNPNELEKGTKDEKTEGSSWEKQDLNKADVLEVDSKSADAETENENNRSQGKLTQYLKNNVALLLIIVALAGTLCFIGIDYAGKQSEINNLKEQLDKANTKVSDAESEKWKYKNKAEKYEDALKEFYLDNAVVVIEGDSKYYHRYGCPNTVMGRGGEYRYNVFNVDLAKMQGHSKCPVCFGEDADTYMNKNF